MSKRLLSSQASTRLIQLTDSHLFASPDANLLGVNTRASLAAVVEQVQRDQPVIDLMLATGDISQDGSVASYQAFLELSSALDAPMAWLPGNHDERLTQQQLSETARQPVLDLPHWRVIMLDSSVPGQVQGYLAADQLELLQDALDSCGERQVLVCLHHPPVASGSAWLDRISLENADELFACLACSSKVRAVLCGHIHQELDVLHQGIRVLATPSSCIQFLPASQDFALDQRAPGYRWLTLHPDGSLDTAVVRLPEGMFVGDSTQSGY